MARKVAKFGGSSLSNAENIEQVCSIVENLESPVVVVSAVGIPPGTKGEKTTDLLISAAKEAYKKKGYDDILEHIISNHNNIVKELGLGKQTTEKYFDELRVFLENPPSSEGELSLEYLDKAMSFGERISSRIVSEVLEKRGKIARAFDAYDLGMITNSEFSKAQPLPISYNIMKNSLDAYQGIPVVTGFIGKDTNGKITTLGRGGSDYTASLLGVAAGADEILIYSDVPGIMTANPKIVPDAKTLEMISFEEAKELSYQGAKLHPHTILPAMEKEIDVRVLNTFDPEGPNTLITNKKHKAEGIVKALTSSEIYLVNINSSAMVHTSGFMHNIYDLLKKEDLSIDMVSTSEANVSFTLPADKKNKEKMQRVLDSLKDVERSGIYEGKAQIYVVGEGMKHTPGVAAKVFGVVGKENISLYAISQGVSEINIGFIVDLKDRDKAMNALHKHYFGDQ